MLPNVQEKWTAYHWGIWVLMCGLLCAAVVNGCPHKCSCSGSHVDCQGQGFRTVPKGIPRNAEPVVLTTLMFSPFSCSLSFSLFHSLSLSFTLSLSLSLSLCLSLSLSLSVSLSLSLSLPYRRLNRNKLQVLPELLFQSTPKLGRLDLSENQIQAVPRKAFRGITTVKNLQLDSNHISCIEDGAFRALRDLEILTLNNNNITLIPLSSFNHMPKLRTLRLHSNNLHCDCHLSWLSDWLRQRRGLALFTQCMAPANMRGLNIPDVQKKDFTCTAQAKPHTCIPQASVCPASCTCNNNIVDCRRKGLTEIPANLPEGIVEIRLEQNLIKNIPAGAFSPYKKLKRISSAMSALCICLYRVLYGNKIAEIPKGLFDGLCAPCLAGPCLNNGTCASNVSGSYHCTCPFGYKGQNCEISINACISFPCANGGTCYVIPGQEDQFSCTCPPGYEGLQCEVNPDDCEDNDCENNSTCVDSINNYTCFCPPNFIGDLCEEGVDPCMQGFDPCQHDSKCLPLTKGYRCECLPGYVGQHCEQDYNDCLENKCQHGAECVDAVNGYTCVCKEGFSGLFCENPPPMILLQTSPCDQSECQNGAQCLVMAGEPVCRCLPGFTGNKCHKIVTVHLLGKDAYLELSSAKIRNSAHISLQVATDKDNGILLYKEDHDPLALELYQGHIRIIYDIANYPLTTSVNDGLFHTVELLIQNHSLSLVVDKGSPKRLGKLPRQPSVDHSTHPQAFNGCIHNVRINGELQDLGAAPRRVEGILPGCHSCSVCAQGACRQRGETGVSCECPPSHSGSLCHQKTAPSPCQSSRCIHGLCVPKASSYSCQCAEGYTGQYCDRREEPQACRGHQCRHGECRVPGSGEPSCHCQPGSGPACVTDVTCQGEAVRELLKRQQPMNTCTSTSKIPRVECPRACDGGLCCAPSKTRRRKVVFKCTDGSSFSEEIEITLECGCAKCPL
uniref:Slit homolog 3 (Drosophila) n=1 Tax=Salmo trutta TaxID=8032 RepID=A0A673YPN1_SALTR